MRKKKAKIRRRLLTPHAEDMVVMLFIFFITDAFLQIFFLLL